MPHLTVLDRLLKHVEYIRIAHSSGQDRVSHASHATEQVNPY